MKKMKIKSGERDFALELMQKFCYAKDEETYDRLYHLLDACGMPSVKAYFDTHWADIREEWIDRLNDGAFTFGERTNNRLESINAKIKSVCTVNADIASFFDNFLAYLSSTRNERDHGTLMTIAKRRVTCENAVEKQFAAFLTLYALDKVVHQLRSVSHIEATLSESENESHWRARNRHGDKLYAVNAQAGTCDCSFSICMHLPCRHVFAVRTAKGEDLFNEVGISDRWTVRYLKEYWSSRLRTDYEDADVEVSKNRALSKLHAT